MEFEVMPKQGLGFLKFGMEPAEVGRFDYLYGKPQSPAIEPFIFSFSAEEIEEIRNDVGEEALKAILDALQEEHEYKAALRTEFRANSSLKLDYLNNALSSIQASRMATGLSIDGVYFFTDNPRDFLAALQERNGEPPIVKGMDCVFRNIYVYVWASFEVLPSGVVKFYGPRDFDDLAQDKSIVISVSPRNADEDFSGHVSVSFS